MEEELTFYNVADIQRILKIGRTKAYRIFSVPGFPTIRINNQVLVLKSDFETWIKRYRGKNLVV